MFAERLACELQTYFRSSLLSLRNIRRDRSDNPKYVYSPQAGTGQSIIRVICKKLGVVRWLDCPCEIIWKLHFNPPSKQFLYVFFSFCLLPSSSIFPPFMLFSYLVAPLPVLSFQEAKMFRSWCPYKIFQPLLLIHLNSFLSTFSLYFCARNS